MQKYPNLSKIPQNQRSLRTALVLGLLGCAPFAYPQDDAPSDEEEIFELSPFEVTAEEDEGYRATSSLAGTRIRTELKDVGSAISVYTEQFLDDVGATDSGTLLQYATNAEVGGTKGTFAGLGNGATLDESSTLINPNSNNRVRGLSAAENTRNFFVSDIPWDGYNVDRIDVQRGPNSILFGLGKPAGIINATLADASMADENEISLKFGSYGSTRLSGSFNKVLIEDELAVHIAVLSDNEKFQQDPAFEDDQRIYGAVRWQPNIGTDSMRTTVKANFEHGEIDANRPRTITPVDSVSQWFDDTDMVTVENPYVAFSDYLSSGGASYEPWLTSANINAQQPVYLIDGTTGSLYGARAGYINNGALGTDGTPLGSANGLEGKLFSIAMMGLGTLDSTATNLGLDYADSGQYRRESLQDSSVFDYYNTLIDGDNKSEFSDWNAVNFDVAQTWLNDRVGLNLSYDSQSFERGGESLLGWSPAITVDVLESFDDGTANPNVGRPYVTTTGGGTGQSYASEREFLRASLFAELRSADFMDEDSFLGKLIGRNVFNAVLSEEDYETEQYAWYNQTGSEDWYNYWTQGSASSTAFYERMPTGFLYLGDSLSGMSSASGANIPGLGSSISLTDTAVTVFDSTWNATGVDPSAAWTIPANLAYIFDEDELPLYQNSNPDNYVGWTTQSLALRNHADGAGLYTSADLQKRETSSKAITWQGFLWNGAIVPTLGWREDEVKSRGALGIADGTNSNFLDLSSSAYVLPSSFDADSIASNQTANIEKADSTSGGIVVHLNKFLSKDNLPLNVSLSYNKSSNFEVGLVRKDLYGNNIANPSGETKDYGILLSTKDNRYSFRAVKYESVVMNSTVDLPSSGLGSTIANGLNWRNVFLYDLAGYDWSTAATDSYRNKASTAYPELFEEGSAAEAAWEDAAISQWNEIQAWLTDKGFFEAWGFTPQSVDSLTDRSTYAADPTTWAPNTTDNVYLYRATAPQNFAVTADTYSEGYEFELTANPTPNWRISMNASKSEAYYDNVGGETIDEFVAYMDSMLIGTEAGALPRWGNPGGAIYSSIYSPWRANYVLMKLQEGSNVPELRKWRYNIITNYAFSDGKLKGVNIGGSYRWQDKVAIGYPISQGTDGVYNFDFANPYYGPSEDAIDLWASYSRPLNDKVDWKVQLNIRNAFADDDLIPISVQPDGSWAGVRIAPTEEWYITNTFSF
ncbi:TonB-dependent receptor plug domain-containing protein [Pelagicoccus albus]|uniref:TonB-dependent receptor plug domain-containing protein n=1 Tax=Pelagicoccus albus TaxID=415222 RepID=A0A7X1B5Z8_9BACT|nr:TonB-dependent receptor plug domain-containing protein [Pelagicoccus albus]MBC2605025.1 TonB-dependent receptor plug domain-containing protein [Pelagicoccus albus]